MTIQDYNPSLAYSYHIHQHTLKDFSLEHYYEPRDIQFIASFRSVVPRACFLESCINNYLMVAIKIQVNMSSFMYMSQGHSSPVQLMGRDIIDFNTMVRSLDFHNVNLKSDYNYWAIIKAILSTFFSINPEFT